jgi:hypothetical protein
MPNSNRGLAGDLTFNNGTLNLDSGSGDLYIAGNWIRASGTFNPNLRAVFFNGSNAQSLTGQTTFDYLFIDKSGNNLTINNNMIVNQTLTFTASDVAKIITGENKVQVNSSGIVTRAVGTNGWVNGNLQKNVGTGSNISRMYEIGDASNYTPASVTFSTVSAAGDVLGFTTAGEHSHLASSTIDGNKSVNRSWTFINSGVAFDNYSNSFTFVPVI